MALTTAQAQALSTSVAGDATLAALAAANGFPQIAAAFNADGVPATKVWRPDVPTSAIMAAIAPADMPTTAASIGWLQMLTSTGAVDATSASTRTGFSTIFAAKPSLTTLVAAAQRNATRFEALFTTANVSTAYGINVSADDVRLALGK